MLTLSGGIKKGSEYRLAAPLIVSNKDVDSYSDGESCRASGSLTGSAIGNIQQSNTDKAAASDEVVEVSQAPVLIQGRDGISAT